MQLSSHPVQSGLPPGSCEIFLTQSRPAGVHDSPSQLAGSMPSGEPDAGAADTTMPDAGNRLPFACPLLSFAACLPYYWGREVLSCFDPRTILAGVWKQRNTSSIR